MKPPYDNAKREKFIRRVFVWGVRIKAFDGIIEVLGGIALLFAGTFTDLAGILVRNESVKDSHNFIVVNLRQMLPVFLADSGWFAAAYLFSHGIVKIVLVAGLLRDKLWAYPSAIVVFMLFIAYQLYRYLFTYSDFLLVLTVLDLVVIWLTWHEYRFFKKYRVFAE